MISSWNFYMVLIPKTTFLLFNCHCWVTSIRQFYNTDTWYTILRSISSTFVLHHQPSTSNLIYLLTDSGLTRGACFRWSPVSPVGILEDFAAGEPPSFPDLSEALVGAVPLIRGGLACSPRPPCWLPVGSRRGQDCWRCSLTMTETEL